MRVLLDHCLDWRLGRSLIGHTVKAAGKLGWGGLNDRELLEKAELSFEVLVTSDKDLPYQQDLRKYSIAVAILDVPTNRLEDCIPKVAPLLSKMELLPKGRATFI